MKDFARLELIEQLKPVVNEPEFEEIFAAVTADLTGPDRFKLKGELRRIAQPCNKIIDLRKRVDGVCRPYRYRGLIHYMDEVAIKIFENGLQQYRGIYTDDTYDQVHNAENNFRIIAQRERERALIAARKAYKVGEQPLPSEMRNVTDAESPEVEPLEVPYFTFGKYIHRHEERMNYVVPVVLKTERGDSIEAHTSNISMSGMKVKVGIEHEFVKGQQLGVRFSGLAKEFTFDPTFMAPYTVVKVERTADFVFIGLARLSMFDSDEFDAFLLRFINGYKRRYKVNVDNTYNAVLSKGYEQFYFPRMAALPIYFRHDDRKVLASMVLETSNNHKLIDDWLNESNVNQLPSIFLGRRIAPLLKELRRTPGSIAHLIFYTFQVLSNGKINFYCATNTELDEDPALKRVFLACAARTNSFRVYGFDFSTLDKSKAWLPLTLPDNILEQDKNLQRPPSADVMKKLTSLSYLGVFRDITPSKEAYLHYKCKKEELELIKPFKIARTPPVELERVSYELTNFRSESRFGYRTRVRIRQREGNILGTTRDISTMGMQIDTEGPIKVKAGEFIELDLMELVKRAGGLNLTHLRYEVMHISEDNQTLHLRADVNEAEHRGRQFIKDMIENDQDEITRHRQLGTLHGLSLCLRNLCSHSMPGVTLYLKRPVEEEFSLGIMGLSPLNNHLKELSLGLAYQKEMASTRFLLGIKDVSKVLRRAWDKLTDNSYPCSLETYVFVQRNPDQELKTIVKHKADFKSPEAEQKFIDISLEHGCLMFLRSELSRTGKPDISFIAKEFKYISVYASHKAKELERELWSVVGVVDIIDCTAELLNRLQISKQARLKQTERLDDLLAQL